MQDLATVSLNSPVKVFVNQNTDVALNLRQEFIRIRASREGDREAIVAGQFDLKAELHQTGIQIITIVMYYSGLPTALVSRTFHDHCIIFIQTKVQAHRMHIILGLLGIKVAELHGNLSQAQVITI